MTVYLPHFTTTIAVAIQIKLFNVQIMLKGWLVYHLLGLIEISVCDFFFFVSSFKQVPVVRGLCAAVPGIVAFHFYLSGVSDL